MMTDPAASRPGTHLDPDQMADLVEGSLDAAAADRARAHLASCPVCSADFALITGEADLADLGGLLPPMPIPQDVVARVEAALYREPPLGTAATARASAGSPVGRSAAAAQPRRRRFRMALGSLAGAALVVVGGIGAVTALNNATSSSKDSSTAAGNAAGPSVDGSHVAGQGPGTESPQAGVIKPDATSGGSGFSDAGIAQQAQALLSLHTMTPANGTAQAAKPDCPPTVVPAGTKLIGSTQTVYQGKPAWLLLYPRAGSATLVDVYVVDVDMCTSGNPGQSVDHVVITRP
ncbi:hypothetical protein [Catenulispora rubra]|uniref:hypothetical protein n=1 Tax=Catenulispora rubra TaxID=280293 RepID=UPI0018925439|nr:hypothetical protein [Catenulispora rubra]